MNGQDYCRIDETHHKVKGGNFLLTALLARVTAGTYSLDPVPCGRESLDWSSYRTEREDLHRLTLTSCWL